MKISGLLGALCLTFGMISVPAPPVSAGCATSCESYRTQTEFCSTCCRVCVNQNGQTTYEGCDTACVSY